MPGQRYQFTTTSLRASPLRPLYLLITLLHCFRRGQRCEASAIGRPNEREGLRALMRLRIIDGDATRR